MNSSIGQLGTSSEQVGQHQEELSSHCEELSEHGESPIDWFDVVQERASDFLCFPLPAINQ